LIKQSLVKFELTQGP